MPSPEWIAEQYHNLSNDRGAWGARMREAAEMYNSEMPIPLPGRNAAERSALANVAQNSIDQHAMRVASVSPVIDVPPIREGSKRSDDRSGKQRDIHYGWWEKNHYQARTRRRARWLAGYGVAPMWVRPPTPKEQSDMRGWVPVFEEANPLHTFWPEATSQVDVCPEFGIGAVRRTWAWLRKHYPEESAPLAAQRPKPHDAFDVLRYADAEELHLVVVGKADPFVTQPEPSRRAALTLKRGVNWAGTCPLVVPGRITLDRQMGMVDSLYGIMLRAGQLDSLEYLALFDQVVAEKWLEGRDPSIEPRIVKPANPLQGEVGVVRGGTMNRIGIDPTLLVTNNAVDRAERNARFNAQAPSEFGGEFATNVRSNVQSAGIVNATISFSLQEHQEIMAHGDEEGLRKGIKVAKGWNGSNPVSIFVGSPNVRDKITYTADKDLYTEDVAVTYTMPGFDADTAPVSLGNRMALRLTSRHTARRQDPGVKDAEFEDRQTTWEALEDSLFLELNQPGALPVHMRARIMKLVKEQGVQLIDAIERVQREAQQEQAAAAAAPVGSPEQQPGLAEGGLVAPQVAGPLDELALLFQDQRGVARGA